MQVPSSNKTDKLLQCSAVLMPLLAIVFISAFIVASFNPGCLNADTVDQWGQSGRKIYHDWHPATLTILMTYVRKAYNGLQAMVVLQTLIFATGVFLILRRHAGPLLTTALLLGLACIPPILFFLGFVGKDSFMACLLVLAIGLIYEYHETHRPVLWVLSLVALYLALAARHNAVFAVLPLLAWLFLSHRWVVIGLWIVLVLLAFVGLEKMTSRVFSVRHEYPEQGLFLYDLAALSVKTGIILVPPEFELPGTSLASMQRDLDPFLADRFFWGPSRVFYFSDNPGAIRHLMHAWERSVLHHPTGYLQWRWDVFAAFIGLRSFELQPYIESCVPPNTEGFVAVDSPLHRHIMNYLEATGQSILFRPFFYLCILSIPTAFAILKKRWDILMIAVSGTLYCISYAAIIYQSTFRFACFTVFVTLILLARLAAEGAAKHRDVLHISARSLACIYIAGSIALLVCLVLALLGARPRTAVSASIAPYIGSKANL